MKPSIYRVDIASEGGLYVMPKPSGEWLAEDIAALQAMGIRHVISLLEKAEAEELGLLQEQEQCAAFKVRFTNFPIADRGLPEEPAGFAALAHRLSDELKEGMALAIHCRAGIGRTGMLAACTLQCNGVPAEDAVALISNATSMLSGGLPGVLGLASVVVTTAV